MESLRRGRIHIRTQNKTESSAKKTIIADTLGWLLYQKGNLDRAEKLISQAVNALPQNPQLRYHLGMVYQKQGKKAEARRELEQALKSQTFPEADDARKALNALR